MKQLISRTEATELLAPHLPILQWCLLEAWAEWCRIRDTEVARGNELSPTARARIVYDLAVARARAAFADSPAVSVLQRHGFLVLIFGTRAAIRFKKLRANLLPAGARTRQRMLFSTQEDIPGIPAPATYLIAGYVLEASQISIERLVITCSDGERVKWVQDLDVTTESTAVMIGPAAPTLSPPQVRSTRSDSRREASSR